jgi:putative urate catabolism protein
MTIKEMREIHRDMIGYGRTLPNVVWPHNARIVVQFVLNYEEGGEYCLINGDTHSESYLSEIVGSVPRPNARDLNIESIYEYGSRAGFWRIWRLFTQMKVPVTVFAVGKALEMNDEAAQAMVEANWEVAGHAYRWIDYHGFSKQEEQNHLNHCIDVIKKLTGQRPLGWYTGRISPNTEHLISKEGGFKYYSDSYADDLPYWTEKTKKPLLVIPYSLDTNDFRYLMPQGFNTGNDFFTYVKDAFDYLYQEGTTSPKMLSIGLHCRISGRPGRTQALARLLDYIKSHNKVWLARRIDVADYWMQHYPAVR